jgi:BNR repeat protein
MANGFDPPRPSENAQHSIVYRNDEAYCGWPFYCGLWKVKDGSLVMGFKKIRHNYSSPSAEISHDRLTVRQGHLNVIRSTNGGRSWDPASLLPVFDLKTMPDELAAISTWASEPPVDFNDPDTLVMAGAVPMLNYPESRAWLRISTDGGRNWRPPVAVPLGGLKRLTGNGSSMYATRKDGLHLLGMSTTSDDGYASRPLIYASRDGREWYFLSFVTPEKEGGSAVSDRLQTPRFGAIRHIYTRPIVLKNGKVICSARFQRDPHNVIWTDIFGSDDGGRTWDFLSRPTDWGAPGDLVEMDDGRVVCVYGHRVNPPGIRYKVSEDGGRTWGSEIILRDDGGSWDLGYPRVIQHEPGKCLAVYYMNLKSDPIQQHGGVRHIAQTVFTPE